MKTAEFGIPCKAPEPDRCRVCGTALVPDIAADETRTLCAAPGCVAAARAELTTHEAEAEVLRRPYDGKRYGFARRRR